MSDSLWPNGLYSPWNSPGQDIGMGSLSLLQGIFPTQRSNPGLLHCRLILYQLIHKGSPRILEWVAYPFSSRSSWPRNWTGVSCIAGRFFTNWAIRKPTFQNLRLSPFALAIPSPFQCFSDGYHCFSGKSKRKTSRHSIIQENFLQRWKYSASALSHTAATTPGWKPSA